MKDGEIILVNDTFEVIQIVQDGVAAVYNNLLKVYLEPSQVVGTYSCSVENSASEASEQTLDIQGDTYR